MKQYKGLYIDNVIFHNEQEIEEHLKQQALKSYRIAVELFMHNVSIEYSMHVEETAAVLVNNFGYSWEEIEELEISIMKECA